MPDISDTIRIAANAEALMQVMEAIKARGGNVPSMDVAQKAMDRMEDHDCTTVCVHPAEIHHVQGDHGRYMVALYKHDGRVVDAECSCPATTTCWHLLTVLGREQKNTDGALMT